ncbi:MAG TPA: sulfatase-like hydrolase/transferase, partial [Anaerolineae bacterium]
DPYYGGTTGALKGHKFSLFEGGIRVPAMLSWSGMLPAGQVIDAPCAAIDIFPSVLRAAGGSPAQYELDGLDILPLLATGQALPARDLFWEMDNQTAIRRGPWKLVLNGQLVEGEPAQAPLHLANLAEDMGERVNLSERYPDLAAELSTAARNWRQALEQRWQTEFAPQPNGFTGVTQ